MNTIAAPAFGSHRRVLGNFLPCAAFALLLLWSLRVSGELRVGFAHRDITPTVGPKEPIWLAGYGPGRRALSVHDPIYARALVLSDGMHQVAIVSLDVVGLPRDQVEEIRKRLDGFQYVLVASTHNHEAPDVIGIWGPTLAQRGTDNGFLKKITESSVAAVNEAQQKLASATARFGEAENEELVNDSRQPYIKDPTIKTLSFHSEAGRTLGVLVKWSVHPEAMGSRNTALTADYPAAVIESLQEKHDCPVVFVVGAIGGLLAPPKGGFVSPTGEPLRAGQFEFTWAYGKEVAKLAQQAMAKSEPIELTPLSVASKTFYVPVANNYYRLARLLGVLRRKSFVWTGDPYTQGEPLQKAGPETVMAVQTEVALLRLGELRVPCIPGEIYPELVFGEFQDPADPNADYPTAPVEPSVTKLLGKCRWLLVGLANDEIGYIIPKRQWDQAAPFAYGLKSGQYGEINSCGPDVAPILMQAFAECIRGERPESTRDARP